MQEPIAITGMMITSPSTISLEIGGRWFEVARVSNIAGCTISHIIEPLGIRTAQESGRLIEV